MASTDSKRTKPIQRSPQAGVNNFWARFATRKPSKVTSIFPRLLYSSLLPQHPDPRGVSSSRNASDSYEAAAKECREKVGRIVRECHRTNDKFTDGDYDIESDFGGLNNCLDGLNYDSESDAETSPSKPPPNRRAKSHNPSYTPLGNRRGRGLPGTGSSGASTQNGPPFSIHRVEWIFEKPQFTIDGFSSSDIEQGANGM